MTDLENVSDLENLLAIAEEEFCLNDKGGCYEDVAEITEIIEDTVDTLIDDEECQIISSNISGDIPSNIYCPTPPASMSFTSSFKSLTRSLIKTSTVKVQKSISQFFRAAKRLPEEPVEIFEELQREKKDGKPFIFPPKPKDNKDTFNTTLNNKNTGYQSRFKVPKFKIIPDTPFAVDAFSYGPLEKITGYFLTHFHSDHYKGLSNKLLTAGTRLYCSEVTGNLVRKELKIRAELITTLKVGQIYLIEDIHVGVLDANHCPGSVMFVFGVPVMGGLKWHLHCGDFRADPSIFNQKLKYLENNGDSVLRFSQDFMFDSVYLDTTYAHPKHAFPPQEQVIAACVDGCSRLLCGQYDPAGQKRLVPLKWMISIGSYLIGKERIILALAETFDLLIYADERKRSILRLLQWPELEDRLTDDPLATPLHFVSMSLLGKQKLTDYRDSFNGRFSHVLGIRPTGWTFTSGSAESDDTCDNSESAWSLKMPKVDGNVGIWPVPYSEHSSYKELAGFLKEVSAHKIIPTVDNHGDVVLDSRRVGGDNLRSLAQWAHRKG